MPHVGVYLLAAQGQVVLTKLALGLQGGKRGGAANEAVRQVSAQGAGGASWGGSQGQYCRCDQRGTASGSGAIGCVACVLWGRAGAGEPPPGPAFSNSKASRQTSGRGEPEKRGGSTRSH